MPVAEGTEPRIYQQEVITTEVIARSCRPALSKRSGQNR